MWSHRFASAVNGLAFSLDGRTLYSADGTCRVYAWDAVARTRRLVLRHEPVSGIVPWGLACADRFVVFLGTNPLRVWDFTAEAKRLEVPELFATKETQVDAARGRLLVIETEGRSVLTWDLVRQEAGSALVSWAEPVRETWNKKFSLSADGRTLAVEVEPGQVIFRAVPSGSEIGRVLPVGWGIYAMFLSPDGRTLCYCDCYRWRLWDVPAGTVRCELGRAQPLAFHPTAPVFAVASPGNVTLMSTQTGEAFRSFDFDLGEVRYACFSPDGLTCAAGGTGRRFAVFDVDL